MPGIIRRRREPLLKFDSLGDGRVDAFIRRR
jgi:hypothetical protein